MQWVWKMLLALTNYSIQAVLLVFASGTTGEATVTYDTVDDLTTVQATLADAGERNITSDLLAKGFHPVYVSCRIAYTQNPATAAVSTAAIQREVQAFIENAAASVTAGDLIAHLARTFDGISGISPVTFDYELHGPDGQLYTFTSTDVLTVDPVRGSGAVFTGYAELRDAADQAALAASITTPADDAGILLLDASIEYLSKALLKMGVSERTVRYLVDPSDVTVTVR